MSEQFNLFTSFFHQDALDTSQSLEEIANFALDSMAEQDIEQLTKFLSWLSLQPDKDIRDVWNNSRSEILIRGGNYHAFVGGLVELARARLPKEFR